MKHLFQAIVFLFTSVSLFAQVQQGYVKTNGRPNRPGVPLQNVTVKTGGHAASLSDDEGCFSIAMPGKKGGDPFVLTSVTKQGYELADRNAIGRQFGFSGQVPFAITMISQEELQADKKRIRDNAISAARKEYSHQLEVLEKKLEEKEITEESFSIAIKKLQSKLDRYNDLAEDLANRYARTDYDIIDDIDKKINEAIEAGDLNKADSLISSKGDIEQRHQKALEWKQANTRKKAAIEDLIMQLEDSENKYRKERDNLAEDYYIKFTIAVSRMQQEEALSWLEKRTELDPENFFWLLEAERYCKNHLGDINKAMKLTDQMYTLAKRHKQSAEIKMTLSQYGSIYSSLCQYDKARKCYNEIIRLSQKDADIKAIASAYNNLGVVEDLAHNEKKALDYYSKCLDICTDTLSETFIKTLGNISTVYFGINDYNKALEYLDHSISLAEKTKDTLSLSALYNNKAAIISPLGKHKEAISFYKKALDLQKKILAPSHTSIGLTYNNLAWQYISLSQYKEALSYSLEALKIQTSVYGEFHPKVADCYDTISAILRHVGNYKKALEYALLAEQVYTKLGEQQNPEMIQVYIALGVSYSDLGDSEAALASYKKAEELSTKLERTQLYTYSSICHNMALQYMKKEEYDMALKYIEKAMAITEKLSGKTSPSYISNLNVYALIKSNTGEYDLALKTYEDLTDVIIEGYGTCNHLYTNYTNIGVLYLDRKNYDKAREYLFKALDIAEQLYSEESFERMTVCSNIAMTYFRNNQYRETVPWIKKASEIRARLYPGNPPRQYSYLQYLNKCYWELAQEGDEEYKYLLQAFVDTDIYKARVKSGDNLARQEGLDGEYYLVAFSGWEFNDLDIFADHFTAMKDGDILDIILYRDGEFIHKVFSTIRPGIEYFRVPISKEEKMNITQQAREKGLVR